MLEIGINRGKKKMEKDDLPSFSRSGSNTSGGNSGGTGGTGNGFDSNIGDGSYSGFRNPRTHGPIYSEGSFMGDSMEGNADDSEASIDGVSFGVGSTRRSGAPKKKKAAQKKMVSLAQHPCT